MPLISLNYDSDFDIDRRHLQLATHQQIITHYEKVNNSDTVAKKEKTELLELAMKKALEALKRAKDKLEKANQTIEGQKVMTEETKVTFQKQRIMLDDLRTAGAQRHDENILLKIGAMSIGLNTEEEEEEEDGDTSGSWGSPLKGSGLLEQGQKRRFEEEGKEKDDRARKKIRMEFPVGRWLNEGDSEKEDRKIHQVW